MSLTKKEEQELEILMTRLENADFEDAEAEDNNEVESDFRKWVEQKKKEWQEEAHLIYVENNEGVEHRYFLVFQDDITGRLVNDYKTIKGLMTEEKIQEIEQWFSSMKTFNDKVLMFTLVYFQEISIKH